MTRKMLAVYTRLLLISTFLFFLASVNKLEAQEVPDLPELQIDPNILKNATPGELRNILQDVNRQQLKPGEDVHKRESKEIISTDSTKADKIRKSIANPESVYGIDIFQNSQILQLAELSTPPEDYIIGVGDHIVVSLWGGADFEEDYIVARDGSIFPRGLGKITLQGLTFSNARAVVYDRFKRVIPIGTNISVTRPTRTIVVKVTAMSRSPAP